MEWLRGWSTLARLLASALATRQAPTSGAHVIRRDLSAGANDWEPSLAVAGTHVFIIAVRKPAGAPPERSMVVTWSSGDRGLTLAAGSMFDRVGGDVRIKASQDGTVAASWIEVVRDSTGRGIDMSRGGLVIAISHDFGETWRATIAAPMASGVADKPELALSRDGHDVYVAFMGPGTLDVVASHDGGSTWVRSVADSTRTGHWPMSMVLGPGDDLYLTDARQVRMPGDSLLEVEAELLRSADGGRSWRAQTVSRSRRSRGPGACVHGSACPVQIPYASVGVDGQGRVHLISTEGDAGRPYALRYRRSTDRAATWSDPVALSAAARLASGDGADHFYPMIDARGDGLVYIAWFDDRRGSIDLWARQSPDGGTTWSDEVQLSRPEGMPGIYGEYGGIGIDRQGAVHVTWAEGTGHIGRPAGQGGVWYARWDGPGLAGRQR
jgi:hypothetical protein